MKAKNMSWLLLTAALGLSAAAHAANFDVTDANDDGTGNTANTLSWAIRQANVTAGADTITLKTNVTVTGVMKRLIDGAPSGGDHDSGGGALTIQSDATRRSISGGNAFRPLFVKSGTVTIQNVDLINGKAKGGDSRYGGGGAGLGGALFVYDGNVTVRNVAFSNNNAVGGNSSVTSLGDQSNGGGGMFGNSGGCGGGGLFGDSLGNDGGYGGFGGYGGHSDGGFGGGGSFGTGANGYGGTGGFGGGGSLGNVGGQGGFGGGGFLGPGGAGGGGSNYGGCQGQSGMYGGGGAGLGGAMFVMKGSVTLIDVSFGGNNVTGGSGSFCTGWARGSDLFICTDQDSLCGATVRACGSTVVGSVAGGTLTVPVCGCGLDLPASTWLMTAPACQPAGTPSISAQYGPGIPGGAAAYGISWIGYVWDAAATSPQYVPLGSGNPLRPGNGSWLYSSNSGAVSMAGGGTATTTEDCTAYGLAGQCFAINLIIPPAGASRWNFVGHPFPYTVSWADVRVATHDGSAWTQRTPSQAAADSIMAKEQWRWSGNAYESKDDATAGLIGTLLPQEAVWVQSLAGSSAFLFGEIKLLVPAR